MKIITHNSNNDELTHKVIYKYNLSSISRKKKKKNFCHKPSSSPIILFYLFFLCVNILLSFTHHPIITFTGDFD